MSSDNHTTWTCDRCLGETVTEGHDQPQGWTGLSRHTKPNHAESGERLHLCPECDAALDKFLRVPAMT